jgi:hypothetical protein
MPNDDPDSDFERNRPHIHRYYDDDELDHVPRPSIARLDAEIRVRHARRTALVLLLLIMVASGFVALGYEIREWWCKHHRSQCPGVPYYASQPGLPAPARSTGRQAAFFEALPASPGAHALTAAGTTVRTDDHLLLGHILSPIGPVTGFVVARVAGVAHQTTLFVSSAAKFTGTLISAPGRTCDWTIVGEQLVNLRANATSRVSFAALSGRDGTLTMRVRSDGDPTQSCAVAWPSISTDLHAVTHASEMARDPSRDPARPSSTPSLSPSAPSRQTDCTGLDVSLVGLLTGACTLLN